jgi:anti-sigma B factor antagonist
MDSDMPLEVETEQKPNGVTIVKITGALALGRESQRVEAAIDDLVSLGRARIVLDLGGVEHIDSTGVGIVTFCFGRMKEVGGTLRVARASGKVRDIFRITSVDQLVPFDDSLDAAVASA